MTDDPTPDDPTHEAVRRLLADARHTAPLPTDVATRLDGVLAELHRTRPAAEPQRSAVVVPIASRRRLLATGLVAAAAVVAVGVALPGLVGGLGGSGEDSAGSTAADTSAGSPEADEQLLRGQAESQPAPAESSGPADVPEAMAALPTVRPERFERDAARARAQSFPSYDAASVVCGTLPAGEIVPVLYRDRNGYLVFSDTEAARERVGLYVCPEGRLVRQSLLPAP